MLIETVSWRFVGAARRRSPERIHDLRVAIRRALNGLDAFKPLLPKTGARRVQKRLRAINKLAGKVRDTDIALNVMFSVLKVQDKPIYRSLCRERKEAGRELEDELRGWMDGDELEEWRRRLRFSSVRWKKKTWRQHHVGARKHVFELLPPVAAEFFARGRGLSSAPDHESLHKFRLHGKRLRDLIELFEPFYGSEIESILSVIRETHRILGDFNDLVTTREMLVARGFFDAKPRLFAAIDSRIAEKADQFLTVWRQRLAAPEIARQWSSYLETGEWPSEEPA